MNRRESSTLRVAHITDVHLTPKPGSMLYNVDTGGALQSTVAALKKLNPKPELVIATGDLAEDGAIETYNRFKSILSELAAPVYTLPGNHDNDNVMNSLFNDACFHHQKSAKYGNWGFAFVNSQVIGESHGFRRNRVIRTG